MFGDGARCVAVVGAQWGDEGKGKIIDVLAEQATIVARYQGGANAGHTVRVGEEEFILHLIPSGVLYPDVRCLLGNGVVVDPWTFLEERAALIDRGLDLEGRIGISSRAHLVLPYHKQLDAAQESTRGGKAIGTTGRGIGPAYRDKAARIGLRVGDLADLTRCVDVVRQGADTANSILASLETDVRVRPEEVLESLRQVAPEILKLKTDVGAEIRADITGAGRVLLEGAQGALLDIDHGTYPYVTSSSTTAGGRASGVRLRAGGPTLRGLPGCRQRSGSGDADLRDAARLVDIHGRSASVPRSSGSGAPLSSEDRRGGPDADSVRLGRLGARPDDFPGCPSTHHRMR